MNRLYTVMRKRASQTEVTSTWFRVATTSNPVHGLDQTTIELLLLSENHITEKQVDCSISRYAHCQKDGRVRSQVNVCGVMVT